jgi:predicted acylesterase/phospholipase RssA
MTGRPYRVLSLDGGGIRGLYTATLLQQLAVRAARFHRLGFEERLDVGAQFDLIVGTSTGSILATALAAGVTLEDVLKLYRNEAAKIFRQPMPLQGGCKFDKFKALVWALRNTFRPANAPYALRYALQRVLKEETLGELYERRKVALCVPSVNAETKCAWVFKTPHAQRLTRDNHYRLVDVCLASSAAPIYFPMHRVESPNSGSRAVHTFVDGGLWANDPVLVALVEALEVAAPDQPIEILSIGTCPGVNSQVLGEKDATRGVIGWTGGIDIVGMSLEAQASVTHYLAQKLAGAMGGRITLHRLAEPPVSPKESKHLALDAADKKSLDVLEMLGHRAADINMSALTNSPSPTSGQVMTLAMFSGLKQLEGEEE